jgi:hypothetical protein
VLLCIEKFVGEEKFAEARFDAVGHGIGGDAMFQKEVDSFAVAT